MSDLLLCEWNAPGCMAKAEFIMVLIDDRTMVRTRLLCEEHARRFASVIPKSVITLRPLNPVMVDAKGPPDWVKKFMEARSGFISQPRSPTDVGA